MDAEVEKPSVFIVFEWRDGGYASGPRFTSVNEDAAQRWMENEHHLVSYQTGFVLKAMRFNNEGAFEGTDDVSSLPMEKPPTTVDSADVPSGGVRPVGIL